MTQETTRQTTETTEELGNDIRVLPSRTTSGSITHIFHVADIHIRNGDMDRSRYDEYTDVFNGFLSRLDAHDSIRDKTALIVIAGDLFHHKGRMDTPALKLYFSWMDQLLARAPVCMICGNHDYRQEDPKNPDMLETMVLPYKHTRKTRHPIYYLKDTGHYLYENIGFGVMSIKETLRAGATCGIVDELPKFPTPSVFEELDTATPIRKVALFHGSIAQSALPNEHRLSRMHGYPLDWFAGYDMVMLGDNHKQQLHSQPFPWAYPGSMVQQDFGEPTFGHGYILWDVSGGGNGSECGSRYTTHHIDNPYGLITVKWSEKSKDYMVVFGRKDVERVAVAVQREGFPSLPFVRIVGSVSDEAKVRALLQSYDVNPRKTVIISSLDETDAVEATGEMGEGDEEMGAFDSEEMRKRLTQLSDLNSPSQWIEYLQKVAPDMDVSEWLNQPQSLKVKPDDEMRRHLTKDLLNRLEERNAKIEKTLQEYLEELYATRQGNRIVLKHMSWDYAMCFGQNNYFDFAQLEGTIGLLNGRNASGKSSFLDVLCIGLYGEPTKHRNMLSGRKMTAKMLHDQRPANKSAMHVAILFTMDSDDYEISRSFTTKHTDDIIASAQLRQALICKVHKNDTGEVMNKEVVCEGATAVENWVNAHFGTIDDMLMSTIVCQMDLTNFFYMKQDEQKAILDHALQLGSIAAFGKVLKEAILAYNDWTSHLRTSIQSIYGEDEGGICTEEQLAAAADDVAELEEQDKKHGDICTNMMRQAGSNTEDLEDLLKQHNNDAKVIERARLQKQSELEMYRDVEDDASEQFLLAKGEVMARYEQCAESLRSAEQLALAASKQEIDGDNGEGEVVMSEKDAEAKWSALQNAIVKHKRKERVPSISKAKKDEIEREMNMWQNNYTEEWLADPDAIALSLEDLQQDLEVVNEAESELLSNPVSKPKGSRPSPQDIAAIGGEDALNVKEAKRMRGDLKKAQDDLAELMANPVHPVRNETAYPAWQKEWNEWQEETGDVADMTEDAETLAQTYKEYATFVEERKEREKERITIENEIKHYTDELDDIKRVPFNPECFACIQQPSNIRRQQIEKNQERANKLLARISRYLARCEEHGDISEMEEELQSRKKLLEKRRYYEKLNDKMTAEHSAWKQAKKEWVKKREWDVAVAQLQARITEMEAWLTIYDWEKYRKWQEAWDDTQRKKSDVSGEVRSKERFLTEYKTRERDIITLQEETEAWKLHDAWLEKNTELTETQTRLEVIRSYWDLKRQFAEIEEEVKSHGENMERVYRKKQIEAALSLCVRAQHYLQWKKETAKHEDIRGKLQKGREKLLLLQHAYTQGTSKRERIEYLQGLLDTWTGIKTQLQQLDGKFNGDNKTNGDGYKEWIYRERVGPLVEKEVNNFLATIEPFRLKIVYDRKCFVYYLDDRGNMPTLDKASGYQNFVVSLAMRLALSRIGAVGQNVRHLFIDEGFTACDVANIEKVPQLLNSIMSYGGYMSILLMSHLEQVQEAAHVRIDIGRRGVFSIIQWGSEYPNISLTKPTVVAVADTSGASSSGAVEEVSVKKRGRPKKQTS